MSEEKRYNPISRKNEEVRQESLSGERALYRGEDLKIYDTVFHDGESPLKESKNIEIYNSEFQWKYPVWYSKNVYIKDCVWQPMGRSGVWYTDNITVENSLIWAPKNFRRCNGVTIKNSSFADAQETLWNCKNVKFDNVTARGDYFGMNSEDIVLNNFNLYGNYCFDGAKNIEVHNSKLISKDAFWNCENVTVYDSYVSGEYLAWNSKNIKFINCTIESEQGLCYIDNLTAENCKLVNTSFAFEYAENIDAEITNKIDSILNPGSGKIKAEEISDIIIEKDNCNAEKTEIVTRG